MAKILGTEDTLNPERMRIFLDHRFKNEKTYSRLEEADDDPLARSLLLVRGVDAVSFEQNTVILEKSPAVSWKLIMAAALNVITSKARPLEPNWHPSQEAPVDNTV